MTRYIDAEQAEKLLGNAYQETMIASLQPENKIQKFVATGLNFAKNLIHDNVPTADVQEVKRAKWIRENVECEPGYEWRKCSFCHSVIKQDKSTRIDFPWFCEYCGARMDGDEK